MKKINFFDYIKKEHYILNYTITIGKVNVFFKKEGKIL